MLGIPAQQAVVGCKFLHHFIFKKQMFVFVIFLFVLDCTFFLFLLSAQIKRERKYQRKRKISLGFRTLRVHYALFGHCLRSKHLQALGLYAHIAHTRNVVAGQWHRIVRFCVG